MEYNAAQWSLNNIDFDIDIFNKYTEKKNEKEILDTTQFVYNTFTVPEWGNQIINLTEIDIKSHLQDPSFGQISHDFRGRNFLPDTIRRIRCVAQLPGTYIFVRQHTVIVHSCLNPYPYPQYYPG